MPIVIFLLLFGYGWASLLPNGCPEDFTIQRLLPHETDCSKFYKCANGQRFLMRCPRGLYFDEESQMCDWPQELDTSSPETTSPDFSTTTTTTSTTIGTIPTNTTTYTTTTTPITPTTSTVNYTTTTVTDMTTLPTTTTRPIPPVDCPEEWQVKLKLPEDSDCEKYFYCGDDIKLLLKCPKKKRRNFDMVFSANYTKTFDIKDF